MSSHLKIGRGGFLIGILREGLTLSALHEGRRTREERDEGKEPVPLLMLPIRWFISTNLSSGQILVPGIALFRTSYCSEVLIQKSEGYILEARKTEKEDGHGMIQGPRKKHITIGVFLLIHQTTFKSFKGPSMASIFKGLAKAKQKEENFKKRQVRFMIDTQKGCSMILGYI